MESGVTKRRKENRITKERRRRSKKMNEKKYTHTHNKTAPTIKILSRRFDQRCGTSFDKTWHRTTMNEKKGRKLYPILFINRWLMQLLLSRYRRTNGLALLLLISMLMQSQWHQIIQCLNAFSLFCAVFISYFFPVDI